MARPLKGTRKGKIATKKWRKTMIKKYGSIEAMRLAMQERGSKGGCNGNTGGFYACPERASWAGMLGGLNSRRGKRFIGIRQGYRVYENKTTGEVERYKI